MNFREKLSALGASKQDSILSASIVLAVTFALSAVLGFLRSRFLYARFFNCCVLDLDAYNAAFRLPDLIFKLLVTGALSASFIPVFTSHLHKDPEKAHKMASAVINLLLLVFIFASAIVFIFAKPFSEIVAHGFNPYQINLMASLTRILLLAQIFFLVSNFFTGILQVNQIFLVPSLSPIVYNIFIILSIFLLSPQFGIYGVVYGTVIGAFFHLAIQVPSLRHINFKYRFSLNYHLDGVKEIIRLMLPSSLSIGLGEIENTVTLFFASTLAAGSISLLNLALQLMYLPSRIFSTTVGQASLPVLSKNVARNEMDQFRDTVRKTISQSLFIAFPVTALVLVERVAIVRIAFGAKQFPWVATVLTARTLAFLLPAIILQAVIQILVRCFYAFHDTRTPLLISLVSLIASVAASYYFVTYTNLGIVGLAISDTLGNFIQFFWLFKVFINRIDGFGWNKTYFHIFKIFLASFGTGVVSWLTLHFLDTSVFDSSKTINLIAISVTSCSTGLLTFIILARLLVLDELKDYSRHLVKFKQYLFRRL
jgi:putative peptidoglycan lipid II flippase